MAVFIKFEKNLWIPLIQKHQSPKYPFESLSRINLYLLERERKRKRERETRYLIEVSLAIAPDAVYRAYASATRDAERERERIKGEGPMGPKSRREITRPGQLEVV